jgi:hypothetical protein
MSFAGVDIETAADFLCDNLAGCSGFRMHDIHAQLQVTVRFSGLRCVPSGGWD